jgi:hypothetical protein
MGSSQDPVLFPLTPEGGYYRPTAKPAEKPAPVNMRKLVGLSVLAIVLFIAMGVLAGLFIKGLHLNLPRMPWQDNWYGYR